MDPATGQDDPRYAIAAASPENPKGLRNRCRWLSQFYQCSPIACIQSRFVPTCTISSSSGAWRGVPATKRPRLKFFYTKTLGWDVLLHLPPRTGRSQLPRS